ncbi:ABC transporter B family member 9-like [Pistacia vera]|uniref:ABC transporter B family member 9-like n=1 Tax=Pistacia vera TaxID=55513 RepID=UPI001263B902|nr:ABC transporter B family member 9-like [Pistacia vera]
MGSGISGFLQVSCWMVTGERQAARIRGLYLKTILRQDIAFFDTETTTGEVIGRMSGDTVLIQEAMGEKVASFTGEKLALERYKSKIEVAYKASIQQGLASGAGLGTLMLIVISTYGLAIWYGSKLIIEKGYAGGDIINIVMAIMMGGISLGQTSPSINAFAAGQAAAYKMFDTIKRTPSIDVYDMSGITLDKINGEIELKDVYFRYPARPEVQIFSGFSLYVPSGTTAALVGQSGSGKSTVISLVERFYDPEAGEVLIDGFNLKKFQLKWIREQIGLVSQEPILFATTMKENIAYGKEKATDKEIRDAIELANAAKFIDTLPQGLNTMVGEHGTQLSGGQKQRLAIARAILKNPKILLLDEATSALDNESERIVQDALDRVMTNRTTVIVAHRLTTIRNADMIAVVHQGKLMEKGTHEELIKDPEGGYSQLVRLQEGVKESEDGRVSSGNKTDTSSGVLDNSMASVYETKEGGEESEKSPMDGEKKQNVSIMRLASMSKPEALHLLIGSLAASIHGVVLPVFALLLSSSISMFFKPPDQLRKDSQFWALLFVGLGVVIFVVAPFQNYFFGIAGGRLIKRIRTLTFDKVVHQEISWFDDPANSSGAIGARLSTDASTIRSIVGDALALIVQNMATITAALVIAFTANWILAFIILAVSPFMIIEGALQAKFMKGFGEDAKRMYEEASQVANDAVGSIRTVASYCAEKKMMDLYQQKCEGPRKHGVRLGFVSGAGFGFSFAVLFCTNGFCFYIGSLLVQNGKATFEEVFRVLFAFSMAAIAVSNSTSMAPDTNKAKNSAASIFEIIDRKPKIDSSSNEGMTLTSVQGYIELEHVSFKYPTRPDVQIFQDLSLSIPSGKTLALVGESGSGKSTVISLIERFYAPDSGRIFLDNVEIEKFQLSWLRQQMGLVSQEPILFNETIRQNIAYGKHGEATEDEIIAATKASNAHNFIAALPLGYDTNVGERGVQLSGGQKQRIAIARAILKNPKILLLDEATSALDAESERVVQDALESVMVNRTTVVVAHRLTTIKNADIIAVVKNGVIAEKGRHDTLMKIPDGVYASLVALHMEAS